ncbi:conserved hypothetical protein [Methylocella silvestris BL2]|uniref:Uncharacterized protein n=1 Tax=Methylocella silvestris (strain DSM 15510 / CIP 108128 / LMG 27833 / NCIMB 13906 / BL2) TaxID=395965 RepID=B8EM01_METSB|nr:conserved hypothetical protein [Methylocella silvestris BL2]
MRLATIAFAALIGAFGLAESSAARAESIADCEKIQAADAYNQCLARFGPTPRSHISSAKDFGGDGDPSATADVKDPDAAEPAPRQSRHASRGRSHSHSASRHSGHRYYGHYRHGHGSAQAANGGQKRMAFNVVSGRHAR